MRHLCPVVPPHLLHAVAAHGSVLQRERALRTLVVDEQLRRRREVTPAVRAPRVPHAALEAPAPHRTVADAAHGETLPGRTVRTEGGPVTGDAAADEAYDGLGLTWQLYAQVYGRDSVDGRGLPLLGTVHYGDDYDNAFWNGSQMVFGDGDGELFGRFTASVDVIGHELTHGVTEVEAALVYSGQSGALNESVSDVFGSLVKQRALGQGAADADWLIGAELLRPGVEGVALRSMEAPGTAYDDDVLGKDPQPADMAHYVRTRDDNGGVHINSGIPNHAFYLVARALGGRAWERAGQVWYDTLLGAGGKLPAAATFARFAAATEKAAVARYGGSSPVVDAVRAAWAEVGVTKSGSSR